MQTLTTSPRASHPPYTGFLGEHLPSANERRLFQALSGYITSEAGPIETGWSPGDVTDRVIWEFWCDQCTDKAVSFRLYATVAEAWVDIP